MLDKVKTKFLLFLQITRNGVKPVKTDRETKIKVPYCHTFQQREFSNVILSRKQGMATLNTDVCETDN